MTTTVMVVMEPGSDWPGHVGASMNVVASGHGGEDLLRRTREKVDALQRSKQAVRVAVLACNAVSGGAALGDRTQLARTLLGAVTSTTCGRLMLCASECCSHQVRQELLALVGVLAEELRGTTATVSLRLAEASDRKSVRIVETRTATVTRTPGADGQSFFLV